MTSLVTTKFLICSHDVGLELLEKLVKIVPLDLLNILVVLELFCFYKRHLYFCRDIRC